MKCLILAGGFGTRLYPLTINRAKSLLHYEGKPLLTHIVEKIPQGIDINIAANKRFEIEFLSWRESVDREVALYFEHASGDEQKKGAVGALQFWIMEKRISDDLLVIAGDNYFGFNLVDFIDAYDGKRALVAVHNINDKEAATQFGVVGLKDNKIMEFKEKPANPKSTLIATAIYIFPPSVFPILARYCSKGKSDNLGGFISYLVADGEVHAHVFVEPWLDIGSVRR